MSDPIPSCFRGGIAGAPPASTAAGPCLTTSVYETPLGLATLSWSRTVLGLLVRAELRLSLDDDGGGDLDQDCPLTFKIRPWHFFARSGSKRFQHRSHSVDFAWNLTRAKFPASGGPEPDAGFFLSIAVDGEIILVAGDLDDLAFKKMKLKKRELSAALISRREHVTMKENRCYKTQASFGGKERSISIDLSGEMCIEVDGKQILQIRRLRWKFRGSEKVQLEGGDRIQLSWDLHNWLFQRKDSGGGGEDGGRSSTRNAVFVFRFESEETDQGHFGKKGECCLGKEGVYKGTLGGYFGKNMNWSESSSCGGGGGGENGKKKSKNNSNKKKSLLKTSSSSSSSSASSAGSSTVMEWASPEENELRSKEGFSLLVYAWKS